MRGSVPIAALAAAAVAASAARALAPLTMLATVTPARAGGHPTVIVQLFYEMQCGYPGPGAVVVTFPPGEGVPKTIRAANVHINGKAARAVSASGSSVSVSLPPAPRVLCDVIGPGHLVVTFSGAAGLRNPVKAGTYVLRASHRGAAYSARFVLRA